MTILLIDSDSRSLDDGARCLEESGYRVVTGSDGFSGLRQLFEHQPDAAVVDVPPSDMDGWDSVQRIRDASSIPVIVTSARADQVFLKKGLDLGVHGYIVKPFEGNELVDRLAAALRHTYDGNGTNGANGTNGGNGRDGTLYEHDGLSIDWRSHEVRVEGEPVHLTATEFKVLSLLVARRGWVLTHEQLLAYIWGANHMRDKDNVKLHVWNLRQKIEVDPKCPRRILARRGIGYWFVG